MKSKVTMKDIAEKLNISVNAVSIALNDKAGVSEDTRSNILKAAEELGYFDNNPKYVHSYANKNICMILEKMHFKDLYFYSKIILGIEEEARKNGYDIIMNFFDKGNYIIPNCLQSKKVSGVIIVGNISDEYLLELKSYNIPTILVDHTSLLESTDSILTDNKLGAFKATKYLIDKGIKEIGFFGDLEYSLSIKERFFGYQEALKTTNISRNIRELDDYINMYSILEDLEKYIINSDTESILVKVKNIQKMPKAFICSNDSAAIQLNNVLKELGYSIPKDVSIVGFDDIALSNMVVPKLTTVRVNKELMGKKAVKRLIWRMSHRDEPIENIIMSVELIERNSVI